MNLFFFNLSSIELSQKIFEEVFEVVLNDEKIEKNVALELVLLGEGKMREINKRYGGKNKITDVLSFPEKEIRKQTKKDIAFIQPKGKEESLGEILICPARVKKNAKKNKKAFEKELAFVFLHGILHLLGYDHIQNKDAKEMEKKEKKIIEILRLD